MPCNVSFLYFLIYLLFIYFSFLLKMSGKITYNGYGLNEFVAPRTSAYVSQQDWHVAEMTVRETLELAGRCQGVGFKYGKIRNSFICLFLFLLFLFLIHLRCWYLVTKEPS